MQKVKTINFKKAVRIFPIHACNYSCNYCTAFHQYNTPLKWKEYSLLPANTWVEAINKMTWLEWVVISGGEPGLYPGIGELCDGLNCRGIVLYSNCSERAVKGLESLEKPIFIYCSFNIKQEIERWGARQHNHTKSSNLRVDGLDVFQDWVSRVRRLALNGHSISQPHVPDDGTMEINFLPKWMMKTRLEGDPEQTGDKFYSPYAPFDRVHSTELKSVMCSTEQVVVMQDGSIHNCQGHAWTKRVVPMGNIIDFNWEELPEFYPCDWYGACHACSRGKDVKFLPTGEYDLSAVLSEA